MNVADALQVGEVLLARLPKHLPSGHEQEGTRPVIVVGEPHRVGVSRYPQVIIVPVATQIGIWTQSNLLYPLLRAGTGGLTRDSVAMLDHVRGMDAGRVMRRLDRLSTEEYAPIVQGLEAMFDLWNV